MYKIFLNIKNRQYSPLDSNILELADIAKKILEIIGNSGRLFAFEKDEKKLCLWTRKNLKNYKKFFSCLMQAILKMDVYIKDF